MEVTRGEQRRTVPLLDMQGGRIVVKEASIFLALQTRMASRWAFAYCHNDLTNLDNGPQQERDGQLWSTRLPRSCSEYEGAHHDLVVVTVVTRFPLANFADEPH